MNLFDLQNQFWRLDEQHSFSGNEAKLYFFLLYLANRSFWPDWIEYADRKMVTNVNIRLGSLKSSRIRLREVGLINFVVGGGLFILTQKYTIIPFQKYTILI
jgi:hypothetical protein